MSKIYKISYKTYLNDRLKEVDLHGQPTYPLYVQLTFNRKTIFFKSVYFDQFSKSKYRKFEKGQKKGPSITDIIKKEQELMDYVITKLGDSFSFEDFKSAYFFYGTDLCESTQEGFQAYMFMFLLTKANKPALARALAEGSKYTVLYELLNDMETSFQSALYHELVDESIKSGQPYLPIYGFMRQIKTWPMLGLNIMEWETDDTKATFMMYLEENYPDKNRVDIKKLVENWISMLKENSGLKLE